jgi:hypothetical protein
MLVTVVTETRTTLLPLAFRRNCESRALGEEFIGILRSGYGGVTFLQPRQYCHRQDT